jgi:hypothetical protein
MGDKNNLLTRGEAVILFVLGGIAVVIIPVM